jgi:hypothetical protein
MGREADSGCWGDLVLPAATADAVDTTGAGDAYAGQALSRLGAQDDRASLSAAERMVDARPTVGAAPRGPPPRQDAGVHINEPRARWVFHDHEGIWSLERKIASRS